MTDPNRDNGIPSAADPLPYPLRPGEAVYLDMRAEWRAFRPAQFALDDDLEIEENDAIREGSAEWRHLLPDRVDLELLKRDDPPEMEYDDGTPVYMPSRKLLAAIILIALLTLLAYDLYGLFFPPVQIPELPPPPTSAV